MTKITRRLTYIDAMRGFTIILVVYTHILGFIICQIDEPFNHIAVRFRMPLFFFISGFFVYNPNYTVQLFARRTKNRLLQQLLPTIIISAVFLFTLYSGTINDFLYDYAKGGYWFTLVAVEMFLLVAPILLVMNCLQLNRGGANCWFTDSCNSSSRNYTINKQTARTLLA